MASLSCHQTPNAGIGELDGFEALLRRENHEFGFVSPARFIPISESRGVMQEIGSWVIGDACFQASVCIDAGHLHAGDAGFDFYLGKPGGVGSTE